MQHYVQTQLVLLTLQNKVVLLQVLSNIFDLTMPGKLNHFPYRRATEQTSRDVRMGVSWERYT